MRLHLVLRANALLKAFAHEQTAQTCACEKAEG